MQPDKTQIDTENWNLNMPFSSVLVKLIDQANYYAIKGDTLGYRRALVQLYLDLHADRKIKPERLVELEPVISAIKFRYTRFCNTENPQMQNLELMYMENHLNMLHQKLMQIMQVRIFPKMKKRDPFLSAVEMN